MAQLASDVGNRAFASTLGRSPLAREAEQGAGILRGRHGPRRRPVDDRLDPRQRRSAGSGRRRPALGDRSATCPTSASTPTTRADQLNRSVSARAFATGTDVYFAKGEYNPGSAVGRQADRPRARPRRPAARRVASGPLTVSQPGDAMEREADAVADRAR